AAPHTYLSDFQDDVEVAVYTDYRELIAGGKVDAINDLTTLSLHHQVGEASLDAGLHLLTQKPLAVSVRAAHRLVDKAARRGLSFGVFENVRQAPMVRAMSWAVRNGLIGEPQVSVMGSLGGFWSPDRVVADTPWRHDKLQGGGGGSIDIGVHQMHWQRYVVGEIAAVSAVARTLVGERHRRDAAGTIIESIQANVDDTYLATLLFERGTIGQLWWSWALGQDDLTINGAPAVLGSAGSIRGDTIITSDGDRLPLLDTFNAQVSSAEREQYFPLGLTDPYAIQNLDWLRAIANGGDPETSGREGLLDLACAFAMLESSILGRQVSIAEVLDGRVDTYQRPIDEHYGLLS
ncbi:MAG TPA: Gfo/Idh/MocA family oxidoreductase, partial [Roseiflexaceae bacterium]|nr:Gfo/Idh/MocA family oxidoreductase [Roseiflexaceae bacterium]